MASRDVHQGGWDAYYPLVRDYPLNPPAALLDAVDRRQPQRLTYPDGHEGWLVADHRSARTLLQDPRFSARSETKRSPVSRGSIEPFFGKRALPGWLVDMDPPEHTRIRQKLVGSFTAKRLRDLTPTIQSLVDQQSDVLRTWPGGYGDLAADFSLPVASNVISALLGISDDDRAQFQADSAALFRLDSTPESAQQAMSRLYALLARTVREAASNGLLNDLRADGTFSFEEICGVGVLLLTAGHESTASTLNLAVVALLENPKQLERLKSGEVPISSAVEELLRYVGTFQLGVPRTATVDVAWSDSVTFKKGQTITIAIAAANRDPEWSDSPNVLDLGRVTNGHVSFGHGIHQCLGQNLVRVELQVCLQTLFSVWPDLGLAEGLPSLKFNDDVSVFGLSALPVALNGRVGP